MKMFSKVMIVRLISAAAIVLSLLVQINYAWPAWRTALVSADHLSGQTQKPITNQITRYEFAEAIGRAMRER